MLYEIERCAEVFVDACLRDEAGRLLFLSAFGRDTATKELLARMHLGAQHHDGLAELVLKPCEQVSSRRPQRVSVGNAKELEKLTGRLPHGVYGNLTHLWLYHSALRTPQKGADVAWVVERLGRDGATSRVNERLWAAVSQLAAIPLLPHWRKPVLEALAREGMLLRMGQGGNDQVHPVLSEPIGNFVVIKVQLDQERLASVVTHLVRRRTLTMHPAGEEGVEALLAPPCGVPHLAGPASADACHYRRSGLNHCIQSWDLREGPRQSNFSTHAGSHSLHGVVSAQPQGDPHDPCDTRAHPAKRAAWRNAFGATH